MQDDSLKEISSYLQRERIHFDGLTHPPTAGPEQVAYPG